MLHSAPNTGPRPPRDISLFPSLVDLSFFDLSFFPLNPPPNSSPLDHHREQSPPLPLLISPHRTSIPSFHPTFLRAKMCQDIIERFACGHNRTWVNTCRAHQDAVMRYSTRGVHYLPRNGCLGDNWEEPVTMRRGLCRRCRNAAPGSRRASRARRSRKKASSEGCCVIM